MKTEDQIKRRYKKVKKQYETERFYASGDGWHGHIDQKVLRELKVLAWVLGIEDLI